jgi:hypothetical protein
MHCSCNLHDSRSELRQKVVYCNVSQTHDKRFRSFLQQDQVRSPAFRLLAVKELQGESERVSVGFTFCL